VQQVITTGASYFAPDVANLTLAERLSTLHVISLAGRDPTRDSQIYSASKKKKKKVVSLLILRVKGGSELSMLV